MRNVLLRVKRLKGTLVLSFYYMFLYLIFKLTYVKIFYNTSVKRYIFLYKMIHFISTPLLIFMLNIENSAR
ncbi:hypothetical protein CN971_28320 [Bacillus thuringiensis]|uniref:Uncharacterized protein n=1 Tax=Bacillus thuringiensis TaxID=1428 RepID=A0A9X7BQD3_BACTU|nr:hypothetical protein COM82_15405 [Bacillus thuringiensis]PED24785.1 hypothetical protein CON34_18885 [Bacillus thuringiensis]PEE61577.1 hypothetical protein COM74_28865 [Bacillus thuringiensis]PEE67623.1 hypothetical protein COM73_28500 [Bacillus thuringiensis]PEE86079.1 hypothetical protein COM90_25190 [Bacillus thuringiensis]